MITSTMIASMSGSEPVSSDVSNPSRYTLTAREAAASLGVKVETLYAYVSRGMLDREVALDGRTSRFSPADVDRLAKRRRRGPASEGLEVVIDTGLTAIDGFRLR